MFKITSTKGFHITLKNGITISTQFGGGNYCENFNNEIGSKDYAKSNDAELAIWNDKGLWITDKIMDIIIGGNNLDEQVWPRVDIDLWLKIVNVCNDYTESKAAVFA